MKKLTKKSLDELAEKMPVISENTLRQLIGGYKPSCVFNCFNYLDGDLYDSTHYYDKTLSNLGYEPATNGGVPTADIPTIGTYGGFHVEELTSGFKLKSDGSTNGNKVIMTFRSGNIDHAVVVTGYDHDESGNLVIKYRDPTNNTVVRRVEGNYSALYSVGTLYIDSPISGAVDNSVSGLLSGDVYYA